MANTKVPVTEDQIPDPEQASQHDIDQLLPQQIDKDYFADPGKHRSR